MSNRRRAPAALPVAPARRRWPGRWVALLVLTGVVFAVLRGVAAVTAPQPQVSPVVTPHVAVVGAEGRFQLSDTDRTVLSAHLDDAEAGTISTRPRYVGDCAAASWTTLGAGRRAAVDGRCAPTVLADGSSWRVSDWPARVAAAAARRGDARLGTLAGSVPGCVAAVGPGAALAAARPDGTVAHYRTGPGFVDAGLPLTCPITLVDPGAVDAPVIRALAQRDDVTLIVTGIGPAPGSADPSLGVIYRLQTGVPGLLTSASTRRSGIVTLTDLTRTLIDFGRGPGGAVPLDVDGSPLAANQTTLTLPAIEDKVHEVAALSDAAPVGYLSLAVGGSLLFAVLLVGVWRRRWILPERVLTLGSVMLAAMMLTGAVPWARAGSPGLVVSVTVWAWTTVLTFAAIGLARLARMPAAVAGAALTTAAFTVDAALGGPMEPGSLLNSRPIFGLRWYGFGNVTFGAYASAGLLLAGWIAYELSRRGRRRAAVGAVAVIGLGMVVCEGWPSMGTDFGGVIALTPAVLWWCLRLSGARMTWPRLLVVGAGTVVAIAVISVADWVRGPDRRSHLGNFVQRVIDGDALDVVSRKAGAALDIVFSPYGISLVVGLVAWVLMFRFVVPVLVGGFATVRTTLIAVLVTAVLGTLLNDNGIGVWLAATSQAVTAVGCLWAGVARGANAAAAPVR